MHDPSKYSIVTLKHFIEAIRNSGYRSSASAIAELVDNALEAEAARVSIRVGVQESTTGQGDILLSVADNGTGMKPSVLRTALQFGGTTRFDSRSGMGRYGMGLPNSSLSQARRVEVFSWTRPGVVWWCYIDVDEIVSGRMTTVPKPRRRKLPYPFQQQASANGTVVFLSKCDRLSHKRLTTLARKLHAGLGRMFREFLWDGTKLDVNGECVEPVDPLFLRDGVNPVGATSYGGPLTYEVRIPAGSQRSGTSSVGVTFTELPIREWYRYPNKAKRDYGITNNSGVSIMRARREIDCGWYFMGDKRKENYDDWWRCEIHFEPVLDELFGVTHTKQRIHPSQALADMLVPDLEVIARQLNTRARQKYAQISQAGPLTAAEKLAHERDMFLEPPPPIFGLGNSVLNSRAEPTDLLGLEYTMRSQSTHHAHFFSSQIHDNTLEVFVNESHPFFKDIYAPLLQAGNPDARVFHRYLQLMVFAAARAEHQTKTKVDESILDNYRKLWGQILAAFLI